MVSDTYPNCLHYPLQYYYFPVTQSDCSKLE